MKNSNISSRKKVLIAISMLAVFAIVTIVSIVLVLSSNNQDVSTKIKISYLVEGVGAKASANYAIIPNNESQAITRKSLYNDDDETEITFPTEETQ